MDNRLFNVNGTGNEQLLATLKLVFAQEGEKCMCKGWKHSKEKGLILCMYGGSDTELMCFPEPLSPHDVLPIVSRWLEGDFAQQSVIRSKWCGSADVSLEDGWQVYCEDWGHVDHDPGAICAIKPAYAWLWEMTPKYTPLLVAILPLASSYHQQDQYSSGITQAVEQQDYG